MEKRKKKKEKKYKHQSQTIIAPKMIILRVRLALTKVPVVTTLHFFHHTYPQTKWSTTNAPFGYCVSRGVCMELGEVM